MKTNRARRKRRRSGERERWHPAGGSLVCCLSRTWDRLGKTVEETQERDDDRELEMCASSAGNTHLFWLLLDASKPALVLRLETLCGPQESHLLLLAESRLAHVQNHVKQE